MFKRLMITALLTSTVLFTGCSDSVSSSSTLGQKTADDLADSNMFEVTVVNGTGSATYKAGSYVTIEATTPFEG